jgi:hypothetical protein
MCAVWESNGGARRCTERLKSDFRMPVSPGGLELLLGGYIGAKIFG